MRFRLIYLLQPLNNRPVQDKCVCLEMKKKKKKKPPACRYLHKFPAFPSAFLSLARLPAIAHRHQALWWSAPCVLMLSVYDRLKCNTSSLAVTSSERWNDGHNERSQVFRYPCMDGPVHTVLPNPSEETVQIYTPLLWKQKKKKGHFLTENTLYFSKDLPIWSFYVNIVLHNGNSGSYLSRLGYSCACSSNDITERAEHEWCVIISWIMMLFIPALRACVCDVSFVFFYYLDVASRRTEACWIQDLKSVLVLLQMPHMS